MDLQAQSVAKAKSLGGRSLKHPGSASMASFGEIEESNDLVNHIGCVFRYFIVDVVDLGSTPDVARYGRELAVQVYRGMIHKSVESVEMISIYEIKAASIRKRGFKAILDLQSQGVCDSHKAFGEGFHGVLGLNLRGISVAGGVLIYVDGILTQREGCCRRVEGNQLMRVRLCMIMRVYSWVEICENEELLVQGRVRLNRSSLFWLLMAYKGETNESTGYHGYRAAVWSDVQDKVFIQVVTKEILRMRSLCLRAIEVGEIMMRDLQGMQRYLQEREDSRKLQQKGCTSLRRRNQRSSISHGMKVFQRSQGMQVILAKDDQRILQLHRQNRVEHVVTTGCNPKAKGYETIVINTCSRSKVATTAIRSVCELYLRGIVMDA
ncbi:hypothetical protein F2Q70_00022480 [Brassica cretica]|uniref:Uncharacterized protein n=1 Tax=Brassica cretica TaxID=69181 RepID=A0A8S9GY93_BRACR|nr:hypothetical protein F2Q70_00022480 [Brassica cretica]